MTDPTSGPIPTTTTSEPDDTAATTPAAAGNDDQTVAMPLPTTTATAGVDYQVDMAALKASRADASVWASHLADMLAHVTGTYVSPDTFTPWFATYSDEVRRAEARSIAFEIANLPIGEGIDGDSGTLLLDLRNEMSLRARKRADLP